MVWFYGHIYVLEVRIPNFWGHSPWLFNFFCVMLAHFNSISIHKVVQTITNLKQYNQKWLVLWKSLNICNLSNEFWIHNLCTFNTKLVLSKESLCNDNVLHRIIEFNKNYIHSKFIPAISIKKNYNVYQNTDEV